MHQIELLFNPLKRKLIHVATGIYKTIVIIGSLKVESNITTTRILRFMTSLFGVGKINCKFNWHTRVTGEHKQKGPSCNVQ